MENYDVAIIGGGIAGLYCAKKLREKGVESIIILEKLDRWGGRLNTDEIKIGDRVIKDEKGAMRLTYKDPDSKPKSNMPLLSRLIKDMGMESDVVPFHMRPQPNPDSSVTEVINCNSNYFKGRYFSSWYAEQNPAMWKQMFNLETKEEFKSADAIIVDVYHRLLEKNKKKVVSYFELLGRGHIADVIMQQNDIPLLQEHEDQNYWTFFRNEFEWPLGLKMTKLRDYTLSTLLRTMGYSHGCLQMIVKSDKSYSDRNAGRVIQAIKIFQILSKDLCQLKNGWSSLVNAVKSELKESKKVELLNDCKVNSIQEDGEGFILEAFSRDKKIKANHVVMAIPPIAVKALFASSGCKLDFHGAYKPVMRLCDVNVGCHVTKIILYFKDDWWNKCKDIILYGPNSTDLPCGYIYPVYAFCRRKKCKGCHECALDGPNPSALTIYCESERADLWRKIQRLGHRFDSPLQRENRNLMPASESLVWEAMSELKEIFNVEEVPYPILTSYSSWNGEGDHGYGYHFWNVGVDDKNLEVTRPVKEKNLYICNEAWSSYQGFVEGSLKSAENVVDRIVNEI